MNAELDHYLLTHTDQEPPLLQALSRDTQTNLLNGRMVCGHLQGRFLVMLCRMIRPQDILELGTFTGYSALCFAEGSPENSEIITIERNDELEDRIRHWLSRSEYGHKVHLHIGDALQIVPTLKKSFDLAFLDLDKREYKKCYDLVFPRVKPGGYIVVDNTLWGEKILAEIAPNDTQSLAIKEFNDYIAHDNRVEKVMLPLRDGITLIYKKVHNGNHQAE
jgi:caffeoyl-CoA O-methyltransferase